MALEWITGSQIFDPFFGRQLGYGYVTFYTMNKNPIRTPAIYDPIGFDHRVTVEAMKLSR